MTISGPIQLLIALFLLTMLAMVFLPPLMWRFVKPRRTPWMQGLLYAEKITMWYGWRHATTRLNLEITYGRYARLEKCTDFNQGIVDYLKNRDQRQVMRGIRGPFHHTNHPTKRTQHVAPRTTTD